MREELIVTCDLCEARYCLAEGFDMREDIHGPVWGFCCKRRVRVSRCGAGGR
jgi:hypothetical protein